MSFIGHLVHDVTHWPVTGSDGYGGFTFGTPVLLAGRWEQKQELFINQDLEEVLSNAVVYLNTDLSIGDYVVEGDETAVADPTTLDAKRIRGLNRITDLRNVLALRKLWL